MSLFAELKRRNVFRVAAAYLIVAWLLMQVADTFAPALRLPDWFTSGIALLLILGFPLALFFAWAFEMTPDGVRPEKGDAEGTNGRRRSLDVVLAVLVVIAGGYLGVQYFGPGAARPEVNNDRELSPSIAVLPFDNRSAREEDVYFTDGMHDDILTQLAKIKSLKVISRTSVMSYRDAARNMREIGRELDVATILEGGVQRAGDHVRINMQLIDAATDEHLWAETYDRELTTANIFQIQSEIAAAIAGELHAALTDDVQSDIATAPTQNLQAYDLYKRANAIRNAQSWGVSGEAAALYEEAILLDPAFAPAYVNLAQIYINWYWYRGNNKGHLRRSRAALDTALRLQPGMPEAQISLADYYYKGFDDYERALELLDDAIPRAPQLSLGVGRRAYVKRRSGDFDGAIEDLRRVVELDPRSASRNYGLGQTLAMIGEYEEGLPYLERSLVLRSDVSVATAIAYVMTEIDAESSALGDMLANEEYANKGSYPSVVFGWNAAILERQYEKAMEILDLSSDDLLNVNLGYFPIVMLRGMTEFYLGDIDRAEAALATGRELLEAAVKKMPDDPRVLRSLSLVYAALGEHELALDAVNAAVDLVPISNDALSGPAYLLSLAKVLALTGDSQAAVEVMSQILDVPHNWMLGRTTMARHPAFDTLRDRADYQTLLQR